MIHQIFTPSVFRLGAGAIRELPELLTSLKLSAPLVVIDPFFLSSPPVRAVLESLEKNEIRYAIFAGVVPDPTSSSVDDGVAEALRLDADSIVALGGGSAIDTAKAIAFLSRHPVKLREMRAPVRITAKGLPLIAIPTTAGTGSEATRFCLVTDSDNGDKMVCIGEGLMPTAAIVDYELTMSAPARLSADTGLDAFTHALEAYVGRKANPYSDCFAHHALRAVGRSLPKVYARPDDRGAREAVMEGSLFAGIAFSNSGLALAHAMSAPLGGRFHLSHAGVIAILLPIVTEFSARRAPAAYARAAHALEVTGNMNDTEAALSFVKWLNDFVQGFEVRQLSCLGVDRQAFENAIEAMARETPASGAAANNPYVPDHADIVGLFKLAWR